jgi:hypothetical protein
MEPYYSNMTDPAYIPGTPEWSQRHWQESKSRTRTFAAANYSFSPGVTLSELPEGTTQLPLKDVITNPTFDESVFSITTIADRKYPLLIPSGLYHITGAFTVTISNDAGAGETVPNIPGGVFGLILGFLGNYDYAKVLSGVTQTDYADVNLRIHSGTFDALLWGTGNARIVAELSRSGNDMTYPAPPTEVTCQANVLYLGGDEEPPSDAYLP